MPSFTTPPTFVDGVLDNAATTNILSTAITELQGYLPKGPLTSAANTTTSTTAGPVTITPWDGTQITLASTRNIELRTSGLLTGTVVGVIGIINLTLGGVTLKVQVECANTTGGIDINECSFIAPLTAGTYTLSATLTRSVTAGTIAFAGSSNFVQIVDWGAA